MTQLRMVQSARQELVLSGMMLQQIALLALSTLELQQQIQQELETNPTLDLVEPVDGDEMPASDEAAGEAPPEPPAEATKEAPSEEEPVAAAPDEAPVSEIDYENLFSSNRAAGESFGSENENAIEETATEGKALPEHLFDQLAMASPDPDVAAVARLIIFRLDANGFLGQTADAFAAAQGINPLTAKDALDLIKSFEPTGVGAVDAREALMLQLDRRGLGDSLAYRILAQCFEDLARNRLPAIAKHFGVEMGDVTTALDLIKTLDPRPGRAYGHTDTTYVVPDVVVEKIHGEYVVTLRNDRIPQIRVSDTYLRMYQREKRKKTELGQYLKGKLDSAFFLIKSIEKRQSTIYRVSESIVKHQIDFLEYGTKYLKPMTLRVVADDLGIHESTVSRVTTQKYMQTPQGTFELKYFFTSSIGMSTGEDASARSVKVFLKELIDGEDPGKPLSDQKIAEMLAARGYSIARRTVTKYREQLRIAPAQQRVKY